MPRVFDLIKPLDNRDTYPITDVFFQKGGLREVANSLEMFAISQERRKKGMIVFTIDTGEFYSLTSDTLLNDSWEKIDFSKNVLGSVTTPELKIKTSLNSVSEITGENLSLNVENTSILRIKEGNSLVSLTDQTAEDGKLLFLQNLTDHDVIIKNNYLNNLNTDDDIFCILTGTNLDLILLKNSSVLMQFSQEDMMWRVIGGVALNPTFLSLLDTPDEYPVLQENNNMFLSLNTNQNSEDKVIFNNPFPINLNQNGSLSIKNINGLRIRKFDSLTGEILFAKFEPTFTITMQEFFNFDNKINKINSVNVTNDSFVEDTNVNVIDKIEYYINEEKDVLIPLVTDPLTPTQANNSFSWQSTFLFDTIADENDNFVLSPNNFTMKITLKDNNNKSYEIFKKVSYRSPSFSFIVPNKTSDFRNKINSCLINLNYNNVSDIINNSSIMSITSNIPGDPQFDNLIDGMTTYQANNLNLSSLNAMRTNTLTDSGVYEFTIVCRYKRPVDIEASENFFDIEIKSNLNFSFTYPIFTGTTDISTIAINQINIQNFENSGNQMFPRNYSKNVGSSNGIWWICVRKNYINGRTPVITLTSEGFTLPTTIIYTNETEIIYSGGSETYVCYGIILQKNINYLINVSL